MSGIEFIDENGGGPGVRLRKRQNEVSCLFSCEIAIAHCRRYRRHTCDKTIFITVSSREVATR